MELREKLKILDLSIKEEKVLLALQSGLVTPLAIAKVTRVTRPAVYDIFKKLKKRGLIESHIKAGKKSWGMVGEKELADTLYETKKVLLKFSDGSEELHGVSDSVITVHRGKEALRKVIFAMIKDRRNERFLGLSDFSPELLEEGWLTVLSAEDIHEFNRMVKKNGIIAELVAPYGWIDEHYKAMGDTWAKDYEGRTASSVYIDKKYFRHSGQIFAFSDALYLLALKDQLVIEIRHSDIQKMILGMYEFMKESGKPVDVNRRLRELMAHDK